MFDREGKSRDTNFIEMHCNIENPNDISGVPKIALLTTLLHLTHAYFELTAQV